MGEHWNTYDTDGFEHTLCGWAWQDHYQCCRKENATYDTARFAYVDTVILYNLKVRCASSHAAPECKQLLDTVDARRGRFPVFRWDDKLTGRHTSWPQLPWEAAQPARQVETQDPELAFALI